MFLGKEFMSEEEFDGKQILFIFLSFALMLAEPGREIF